MKFGEIKKSVFYISSPPLDQPFLRNCSSKSLLTLRLLPSLTDTVQEDMAILKASPYFKNDVTMLGYVFDLEKGTLAEVVQK